MAGTAIKDRVEPILIPQVTGLGPFIGGDFNVPDPGAAFYLDSAPLRASLREEIETWIVREPRSPR